MRPGPIRPQMMEALKKTRPLGQVKWETCLAEQTSWMAPRAHSMTATWTKQDQMVATVCAALGGGVVSKTLLKMGPWGDGLTTWCEEELSCSGLA